MDQNDYTAYDETTPLNPKFQTDDQVSHQDIENQQSIVSNVHVTDYPNTQETQSDDELLESVNDDEFDNN